MLSPKRTKYRKSFKLKPIGLNKTSSLIFGFFGLKALESARITSRQIEAARKAITRKMKRQGRLWLHLFPHIPVTSKPTEVRMGKGKGNISYWAMPIKPGKILFEKPSQLIGKFFFVERTGASRREREGNKQIHFESDTRSNAKKRARQEAFLFPACWSGGQRGWCIVDPGAFPCIETMSPTDHLGR